MALGIDIPSHMSQHIEQSVQHHCGRKALREYPIVFPSLIFLVIKFHQEQNVRGSAMHSDRCGVVTPNNDNWMVGLGSPPHPQPLQGLH